MTTTTRPQTLARETQQFIANEPAEDREFLELLPQCACVHPDARTCFEIRYPAERRRLYWNFDVECTCGCHVEYDDDEEDW